MSRIRSSVPIFAFSPHRETQARVALFRGVQTIPFDPAALPADKVSQIAVEELLKRNIVQPGDWVILTKGDSYHDSGRHQHHEDPARRRSVIAPAHQHKGRLLAA